MSDAVTILALAVTAAGILCAVGVAARAGLRMAVRVLLDFLLAAGLLRLTSGLKWDHIVATASIVVVRHIVSAGLALGAPPPTAGSRPPSEAPRPHRAGPSRA